MEITNREWSAFERLLRGYVARRVEANCVDDLVSDILLRLVRHQPAFKSADKPAAWMYRVAGNVITDHYRRRAIERSALQAIVEDQAPLEQERVDNESEFTFQGDSPERELARCLTPLIENLPPRYRTALQMVDIEGLPQQEAAEQLGLSLSGVKSRVQRGRVKLKERLLDCCAVELSRQGKVIDYAANTGCC